MIIHTCLCGELGAAVTAAATAAATATTAAAAVSGRSVHTEEHELTPGVQFYRQQAIVSGSESLDAFQTRCLLKPPIQPYAHTNPHACQCSTNHIPRPNSNKK